MSTNRPSHSRKSDTVIPSNLILKWQSSSGARQAKPLVRRPMTACQACRSAKVKCDGKSECNRCTSRGIGCNYSRTTADETAATATATATATASTAAGAAGRRSEHRRERSQNNQSRSHSHSHQQHELSHHHHHHQQQQQQQQQQQHQHRSLELDHEQPPSELMNFSNGTGNQQQDTSMDLDSMSPSDLFSISGDTNSHTLDGVGGGMNAWSTQAVTQGLGDFDWGAMDSTALPEPEPIQHRPDQRAPPPIDLNLFFSPHNQSHQPATSHFNSNSNTSMESPLPPRSSSSSSSSTSTTGTSTPTRSLSRQLFSSPTCRCRETLALLMPRVNNALAEKNKQLDKIYKVTERVMQGCQDIIDCASCQLSCTDLICIITVFQRTDACFEYIAQPGTERGASITMSFGGCEVPVNDPKLRVMLVINLIQQATMVLDSISTRGQNMLRALGTPSALAEANIGYLETVIRDFRGLLRRIAESADATGLSNPRSMDLLRASLTPAVRE